MILYYTSLPALITSSLSTVYFRTELELASLWVTHVIYQKWVGLVVYLLGISFAVFLNQ